MIVQHSVLYTQSKNNANYSSQFSLSLSVCVATHNLYTFYTHNGRNTTAMAILGVIHTIKKQHKLQFSILDLSLSLLPSIIYTHFTHIMAKNTTAMATLHIITEKILLCTPLLSLLTKCLIDSNKILIINIFAIKQRVNRKKSVLLFSVYTILTHFEEKYTLTNSVNEPLVS